MSNIFIKRVAKLLDGLPTQGYSESRKPIRAPAAGRVGPRKQVPSEFELHSQVLHNTWGRIEFEIEPLNQPASQPSELVISHTENQQKNETDYRVRVKTVCRLKPPQSNTGSKLVSRPDTNSESDLKPNSTPHHLTPIRPPIPPVPLKAISMREIRALAQEQANKARTQQQTKSIQKETSNENKTAEEKNIAAEQEKIEKQKLEQKTELNNKLQSAKHTIRKEFACRESRRMMTLLSERKAQAAVLQEKSVFANFSLPVLQTLAKSPQTPKNSLKWLAFHESPAIRKAVAKNKNADLEILAILARDEIEDIRMAVAENPLVDKEFLLKLLNDNASVVVEKAQNMLLEMTRAQAIERNRAALKEPASKSTL